MALDMNHLGEVVNDPIDRNGRHKNGSKHHIQAARARAISRVQPRDVKSLADGPHQLLDPVIYPKGHTPEQVKQFDAERARRVEAARKGGSGVVQTLGAIGMTAALAFGASQLGRGSSENAQGNRFGALQSQESDQPVTYFVSAAEGDNETTLAQKVMLLHFNANSETEGLSEEQTRDFRDREVHLAQQFDKQAGKILSVGERLTYTMDDLNQRAETTTVDELPQ